MSPNSHLLPRDYAENDKVAWNVRRKCSLNVMYIQYKTNSYQYNFEYILKGFVYV